MNSRGSCSHYDLLVQAAETVNKEMGFFTDESMEEEDPIEPEREIWVLRTSLDYYYSKGIYPFGTTRNAKDFCKNWVGMTLEDYIEENRKLRRKYKERVRRVCKKGQHLEPREQEAFEAGNRIWGSRSGGKREDHQQQEHMIVTTNGVEHENENEQEDPFARFPLLKKAFRFGVNISDELRIPVSSDDIVKKGLAALGTEKLKEWNDRWEKIQIEELKVFLQKLNLIREQSVRLLAEIEY